MTCSVDGCKKDSRARGLCANHYAQWNSGNLPGLYLTDLDEKHALRRSKDFRVVELPTGLQTSIVSMFKALPKKRR